MVAFDYCPLPPPPPTKTWEKSAIQKRGRGKEEGARGGGRRWCFVIVAFSIVNGNGVMNFQWEIYRVTGRSLYMGF